MIHDENNVIRIQTIPSTINIPQRSKMEGRKSDKYKKRLYTDSAINLSNNQIFFVEPLSKLGQQIS